MLSPTLSLHGVTGIEFGPVVHYPPSPNHFEFWSVEVVVGDHDGRQTKLVLYADSAEALVPGGAVGRAREAAVGPVGEPEPVMPF